MRSLCRPVERSLVLPPELLEYCLNRYIIPSDLMSQLYLVLIMGFSTSMRRAVVCFAGLRDAIRSVSKSANHVLLIPRRTFTTIEEQR
jgi:hypothetical protein